VFTAVSAETVQHLQQLIGLVSQLGVKVMMLTDLNFRQNTKYTLWKNADKNISTTVRRARYAFSKIAVVICIALKSLSCQAIQGFSTLLPKTSIAVHQNIPIVFLADSAHNYGNVTVCDCQPENVPAIYCQAFRNLERQKMSGYRRRCSAQPPDLQDLPEVLDGSERRIHTRMNRLFTLPLL
jgi:hypothetical protein